VKLLLIAILLLLTGCAQEALGFSEGPELIDPVLAEFSTVTASSGPVIERQMLTGVVRRHSFPVSFETSGNIDELLVSYGDRVVEGQVLARLNTTFITDSLQRERERRSALVGAQTIERQIASVEIDYLIMQHENLMQDAAETMNQSLLLQAEQTAVQVDRAILRSQQLLQDHNLALRDIDTVINELLDALQGTVLYSSFTGTISAVTALQGSRVTDRDYVFYITPDEGDFFIEYTGRNNVARNFRDAERLTGITMNTAMILSYIELDRNEMEYYSQRSVRRYGMPILPVMLNIDELEGEPLSEGALVTIYLYSVYHENIVRVPLNAFFPGPMGTGHVNLLINGGPVQTQVEAVRTRSYIGILEGVEEGDVVIVR